MGEVKKMALDLNRIAEKLGKSPEEVTSEEITLEAMNEIVDKMPKEKPTEDVDEWDAYVKSL